MPVLEVNGLRHYFRLEGHAERPALVLVHAIGSDHSLWDAVVQELPQFRILRYDLRGHGGTEVAPRGFTLANLAEDLLALTSAVGIERFAVAGVSLGAMVALAVAAAAPQRITHAILCSVAPRIQGPPGGWPGRIEQVLAHGMAPLAPAMIARMFSGGWIERAEPATATIESVFRGCDPAGYAACCSVLGEADLAPLLPQVRSPVLVVRGVEDPLVTNDDVAALASYSPRAQCAVLEAGHYPLVEQAPAFASLAAGFIRRA